MPDRFEHHFATVGPELTAYLCRLVNRPQVAEELAQTAFLRLLESGPAAPDQDEAIRAWLFRVATNLAIDELRRHSTWRETMVEDLRSAAESDAAFNSFSSSLIGTPETKLVAREHLATCFACTMRNLPEHKAAAFWLKEVHSFSLAEAADFLGATETQVKNWLQEARAYMRARYASSCALITKQGVCHQCVELADYFNSGEANPLTGSVDDMDARLSILREMRSRPPGVWHARLLRLIDGLD